jgi:hypothetical protein
MSDGFRLIQRPSTGITPEQTRDARSRAWLYVFECFARRNGIEGGPATAPDDAKGSKHDRATTILPDRT